MTHVIQVIPTHQGVGLTSCIVGLFYAFHRLGIKTSYYKPIAQQDAHASELLAPFIGEDSTKVMSAQQANELLSADKTDVLLEQILMTYEGIKQNNQVVIIGGFLETKQMPYAVTLNRLIAKALGADIVLATDALGVEQLSQFEYKMEYAASEYGGTQSQAVLGAIVNRLGDKNSLTLEEIKGSRLFTDRFRLIAAVPNQVSLTYPRTRDIIQFLEGELLNEGEADTRRIANYAMIARTIPNAMSALAPHNLIITPSDRDDVIMAATLSAAGGNQLAGLILTGDTNPTPQVFSLCLPHLQNAKLPVARVPVSTWGIAQKLEGFNHNIPVSDEVRAKNTMEFFADQIDSAWCKSYVDSETAIRLSPAAFKYQIVKTAQNAKKKIVLPEGDEPRTITAANICATRAIAECVLLADPKQVAQIAASHGITLHPDLKIVDPNQIREDYVARLVELRGSKGMTDLLAREQLQDNVVLGTMMLEAGLVDGLVSGAVHTTANTIRPPLQIIKTAKNSHLVSSVFFMCLPDQVLVYGDCAINPNPDANQLAEIAIQSADSAKAFGILPRVAMISYSTGNSGSGADVDKVREATELVKQRRPDILIDGPLQYDAAAIPSVGAQKAPNSPVAGHASVFIFPDLNTGNTTYKAVQRSAKAISIGPMLQGMRKPVNDLSRGALVDDIVYTIAITAVQATMS